MGRKGLGRSKLLLSAAADKRDAEGRPAREPPVVAGPSQPPVANPSQPSQPKRHRQGHGSQDDDTAMWAPMADYEDDSGPDQTFGDDPDDPPSPLKEFDEADLARTLVNGVDEDASEPEFDLPSLEELRDLADYQDNGETVDDLNDASNEAVALDDDDDIDDDLQPPPPPAHPSASASESDPDAQTNYFPRSVIVDIIRKSRNMNDFKWAFGLYCVRHNVSRQQYTTLKEILSILPDPSGKIASLPGTVDTLKRHIQEMLPLLEMRSTTLALNPKKVSSARFNRAVEVDEEAAKNPTQEMFHLNPITFIRRMLASKMVEDMHFGLALLVDSPTQAYHSSQWAGSIRTTSGKYAYYRQKGDDVDEPRNPVFPGDFIDFKCANLACYCRRDGADKDMGKYHIGQVLEVWKDERESTRDLYNIVTAEEREDSTTPNPNPNVVQGKRGATVLVVGRLWKAETLVYSLESKNIQPKVNPCGEQPFVKGEYILAMDPRELISEDMIVGHNYNKHFWFDLAFGSSHQFSTDSFPPDIAFPVRRIYNKKKDFILPACKVSPVPGLLEMQTFRRGVLVERFVRSPILPISVPIMVFADGFALYRVMHKSLMGVYIQFVSLPKKEYTKQHNIFPVTLGPHGSNFEEVMKALEPLGSLDHGNGIFTWIEGEKVLLCAPVIAFVGDMPQQQENSGILSQSANKGCRSCEISKANRADLDFDIVANGRAHYEVERQRMYLQQRPTPTAKKRYSSKTGVSVNASPVVCVAPALDLVGGRPADAAHSEFGGITKMLHQIFVDQALTEAAMIEYCQMLRRLPYPPGWDRVQSPYHILQYSLSEHARWSVYMLVLSITWLRDHHFKKPFAEALQELFKDQIDNGQFGDARPVPCSRIISYCMSGIVEINSMVSTDDPQLYKSDAAHQYMVFNREVFQKLCRVAAKAANTPGAKAQAAARARRASTVASAAATALGDGDDGDVVQTMEEPLGVAIDDDINVGRLNSTQKATKYRQWAARPNVHIGLHYREVKERYGLISLLMVLHLETKHKLFKNLVVKTNHKNPEKDLFMYENIVQTVRMILMDGLAFDEPDITTTLKDLRKVTPTLFASLLPEGIDPDDIVVDEADVEDAAVSVKIKADDQHQNPVALSRLSTEYCRDELHIPTREGKMSKAFKSALLNAYRDDYDKPNMVITSNNVLCWWKKVAFVVRHDLGPKRHVLSRGQYVHFINRGETGATAGTSLGRLDHIMTHQILRGDHYPTYVFLIITPIYDDDKIEDDTELPLVQLAPGPSILDKDNVASKSHQLVIGLPALGFRTHYLVPFTKDNAGNRSFIPGWAPFNSEMLWFDMRMVWG